MSSWHHLDGITRSCIIDKIKERRKSTDVVRSSTSAKKIVTSLWKSFQTNGMCSKRHGVGRVRGMTAAEDRRIELSTKRNRRSTSTEVANQFLVLAASASPEQLGLSSCCVHPSRHHRSASFQWCCQYSNWRQDD